MTEDTTKAIATVALGLGLYVSFVPPPQPAAAADLTKEHFDETVAQLSRDIGREIRDNNRALADAIADAVRRSTTTPALPGDLGPPRPGPLGCADRSDCRPPHQHVPTRVVVVEKVVHVVQRPHWCCRSPPPPCPPGWGWY
jgi:hypothetical protein